MANQFDINGVYMGIIYFLVAIFATTVGALAGLGGGVIIKPSLDLLGHYDITTISLLSTFTVFSMAVVSTYKQIRAGFKIEKQLVALALGSIAGGILGKTLFTRLIAFVPEDLASGIQALILATLLLIVLFKKYLPDYHVKNAVIVFIVGLGLGATASFLGIGGGPINVAVIMMFLNMDIKKAAVSSVFAILLSQLSKILAFASTSGFSAFDLSMLWFMVPAALACGLLGSFLNHNLKTEHIHNIFNGLVSVLVLLNLYNAYNYLF